MRKPERTKGENSPVFRVSGLSHHETFQKIGRHYKTNITNFFKEYSLFKDRYLPFYEENYDIYKKFTEVNSKRFPEYMEEITGLARGADVPIHYVMLVNLRAEINQFLMNKKEDQDDVPHECTTVIVKDFLGHNEDGMKINGYLICCRRFSNEVFLFRRFPNKRGAICWIHVSSPLSWKRLWI